MMAHLLIMQLPHYSGEAPETQAQHSIHQWLHQGTDGCPIDFITCARFELNSHAQQTASAMFAHCLSQSLSLMQGISQAACQQQID